MEKVPICMLILFTGHFNSLCYAKAHFFCLRLRPKFFHLTSDSYINLAPFVGCASFGVNAEKWMAKEKEIHEPLFHSFLLFMA